MTSRGEFKPFTVCFTGHRELLHSDIAARLDSILEELVQQGFKYFGAGGALGFDMEASLAVLRLREQHPLIKLILVLPYPGQADKWSREQRERYEFLMKTGDKVTYTAEYYAPGCFHIRNRALVDGSALCVSYQYKDSGGTAYTVGYARKQGLRVINIMDEVRLK